jgi:N utilization substance protein B
MDFRRTARVVALQALFAADISRNPNNPPLDWLLEENPLPAKGIGFAQSLIRGVTEHIAELDQVIHLYAPAWPVNQLSAVDRNILRLALFELLHCTDIPRKTAINEAVELAKVFGSESSARFTNGVLGSVMVKLQSGQLAPDNAVHEGR